MVVVRAVGALAVVEVEGVQLKSVILIVGTNLILVINVADQVTSLNFADFN